MSRTTLILFMQETIAKSAGGGGIHATANSTLS